MITVAHRTDRTHGINRDVYTARCTVCGARWPEALTDYHARVLARGHECEGA